MKTERIDRKKENYLFCELISAFTVIIFNKVLSAVIHTVNYLVYTINGEV